jgi:hypothetical protein
MCRQFFEVPFSIKISPDAKLILPKAGNREGEPDE